MTQHVFSNQNVKIQPSKIKNSKNNAEFHWFTKGAWTNESHTPCISISPNRKCIALIDTSMWTDNIYPNHFLSSITSLASNNKQVEAHDIWNLIQMLPVTNGQNVSHFSVVNFDACMSTAEIYKQGVCDVMICRYIPQSNSWTTISHITDDGPSFVHIRQYDILITGTHQFWKHVRTDMILRSLAGGPFQSEHITTNGILQIIVSARRMLKDFIPKPFQGSFTLSVLSN